MSKKILTAMSILLIAGMLVLIAFHIRWPDRKTIIINHPVALVPPPAYQPVQGNDLVNVNTASLEELMTLNGIGKKIAQNIIEERELNGFFYFPEDLIAVNGIGEKMLNRIRDQICFE